MLFRRLNQKFIDDFFSEPFFWLSDNLSMRAAPPAYFLLLGWKRRNELGRQPRNEFPTKPTRFKHHACPLYSCLPVYKAAELPELVAIANDIGYENVAVVDASGAVDLPSY